MNDLYHVFNNFKKNDENKNDDYQSLDFFREVLESLMDSDDENYESNPVIEILYELADKIDEEVRENFIEGIFDYYDVDDLDDLDDELASDLDENIEDYDEIINEKINPIKAKKMRMLKAKRREQLGKRGNSMAFKRTHKFDNKKRRFVKREKAVSISAMRKKARIFKKTMKKGSNKAKAKRMKKHLQHVNNPYKLK